MSVQIKYILPLKERKTWRFPVQTKEEKLIRPEPAALTLHSESVNE